MPDLPEAFTASSVSLNFGLLNAPRPSSASLPNSSFRSGPGGFSGSGFESDFAAATAAAFAFSSSATFSLSARFSSFSAAAASSIAAEAGGAAGSGAGGAGRGRVRRRTTEARKAPAMKPAAMPPRKEFMERPSKELDVPELPAYQKSDRDAARSIAVNDRSPQGDGS